MVMPILQDRRARCRCPRSVWLLLFSRVRSQIRPTDVPGLGGTGFERRRRCPSTTPETSMMVFGIRSENTRVRSSMDAPSPRVKNADGSAGYSRRRVRPIAASRNGGQKALLLPTLSPGLLLRRINPGTHRLTERLGSTLRRGQIRRGGLQRLGQSLCHRRVKHRAFANGLARHF